MIRVLVADDQNLVRRGLAQLLALASDITVVAEASDGAEALAAESLHRPQVVLLDVRMPGMSGLEALAEFGRRNSPAAILMITTFDDDEAVLQAMALGAKGFLLKDVTIDDLHAAVRTVAAGRSFLRPVTTTRVQESLRALATAGPLPSRTPLPAPELTSRELEILRLMAGGYSNRELAAALNLAEGTVKNHISNVLAKMAVRDRTRAVLKGLDLGLI